MNAPRAASSPTLRAWPIGSADEQIEIRPIPVTNIGFREARSFAIAAPVEPSCTLLVDDEPIELAPGDSTTWIWSPGFYAGEVTAEVCGPDGAVLGLYLLDVAPDPAKTGREAFAAMLEEVWQEDPELVVGSEPATRRIGLLGDDQNRLLELARLRRHAPGFLKALSAVREHPRRALVRKRELAPLHRVRRVDRQTAVAVARDRDLAAFLGGSGDASARATGLVLDVPRIDETLDCAANRCLLALIGGVARRASSLLRDLQRDVDREGASTGARSPIATRWPARRRFLERVLGSLVRIQERHPFTKVQRAEMSASGLNAVAADPLYARAWATGWKALRSGLKGAATDERMWISPTWEVYERWCFVALGRLLREVLPELAWERLSGSATRGEAAWLGVGGETRVELLLQPTFGSAGAEGRPGFWSVSKERVPDLVMTIERGEAKRFVVLDAKYRCARANVLDAMTSAHVYQDSLRYSDQKPLFSLLLIPAGGGASWLEEPAFHEVHRVGVAVLGMDDRCSLPRIVEAAITTSSA